jgi:hypothetical protein
VGAGLCSSPRASHSLVRLDVSALWHPPPRQTRVPGACLDCNQAFNYILVSTRRQGSLVRVRRRCQTGSVPQQKQKLKIDVGLMHLRSTGASSVFTSEWCINMSTGPRKVTAQLHLNACTSAEVTVLEFGGPLSMCFLLSFKTCASGLPGFSPLTVLVFNLQRMTLYSGLIQL